MWDLSRRFPSITLDCSVARSPKTKAKAKTKVNSVSFEATQEMIDLIGTGDLNLIKKIHYCQIYQLYGYLCDIKVNETEGTNISNNGNGNDNEITTVRMIE